MKSFFLIVVVFSIQVSAFAQIEVVKDTVHHYFYNDLNKKSESYGDIVTTSINPIDVKWKIIHDGLKTKWDTNVQFCDCDVCLTQYPDSSVCNNKLHSANKYTFVVYIRPLQGKDVRYISIELSNMNDANDKDTITFMTDTSMVLSNNEFGLDAKPNFVVYPNPANGKINIVLNISSYQNAALRVINTLGETVLFDNIETNQREFSEDVSSLEKGIYIVEIRNGEEVFTQKLLIH